MLETHWAVIKEGKVELLEKVDVPDGTKALVTVLPDGDEERSEWLGVSLKGLEAAYGEDEVEYPLSSIKEPNPDYEGR
jgi:hypothetical protein